MRRFAILLFISMVVLGTLERSLPFFGRLTDGSDTAITGIHAGIFAIYENMQDE